MTNKGPLDQFYKDCLRLGSIQCFSNFSLYLKGREELVLTVYTGNGNGLCPSPAPICRSSLPGVAPGMLPPASPAGNELDVNNPEVTVFLIGAYAKYNYPYVWLRSTSRGKVEDEIDSPLDLETTRNWKTQGLRVWHIVEELVFANIRSGVDNPFAVDFDKLESLPPLERSLQAGALASFLREMLLTNCSYSEPLQGDLEKCLLIHFSSVVQHVPELPGAPQDLTIKRVM